MVEVCCQKCEQVFNVKPSWLKNGYGKYCFPTPPPSKEKLYVVTLAAKKFTNRPKLYMDRGVENSFVVKPAKPDGAIENFLKRDIPIGNQASIHIVVSCDRAIAPNSVLYVKPQTFVFWRSTT